MKAPCNGCTLLEATMKVELFNDNFQNFKR